MVSELYLNKGAFKKKVFAGSGKGKLGRSERVAWTYIH